MSERLSVVELLQSNNKAQYYRIQNKYDYTIDQELMGAAA